MCGLFAGIGKLSTNRMIALGCMNEDRGTDSVGLGWIKDNAPTFLKIAERPAIGLNLSLRKSVTEAALSGMFIGHTRQATKGKVTSDNAHPFLIDKVCFAHNGVIYNDTEFGEYAVDSMSLIHGIKAKDFSKYRGPIALLWIQDGLLQAYRKGNPLWRGRMDDAIYLASQEDQLKAIGCTKVKELHEGTIYTFHDLQKVSTEKVKENELYSTVKVWSPSDNYSYNYDYAYHQDKWWKKWNRKHGKDKTENKDLHNLSLTTKEDFSTWKDDKDKSTGISPCQKCTIYGHLKDGLCRDCQPEITSGLCLMCDTKAVLKDQLCAECEKILSNDTTLYK